MLSIQYLFEIYLLCAFLGIGPYFLLVPNLFRIPSLFPVLLPYLGLMLLAVLSVPFLFLNLPVTNAFWLSLVVSGVSYGVRIFLGRQEASSSEYFFSTFSQDVKLVRSFIASLKNNIHYCIAGLVAILAVMYPTLPLDYLTTPSRWGVDQSGYATVGQFLLNGGTLKQASETIIKEVQIADEWQALSNDLLAVRFRDYVNADFLLKTFRHGLPGILANLTNIVGLVHVYQLEFLVFIIPFGLMLGLVFFFARNLLGIPKNFAFLAALAVGFNCNFLNVLYAGMLAQYLTMPFIFLIFTGVYSIRNHQTQPKELIGLLSFAVGGIMVSYSEGLLVVLFLLAVMFIFDFLFKRKLEQDDLRNPPLSRGGEQTYEVDTSLPGRISRLQSGVLQRTQLGFLFCIFLLGGIIAAPITFKYLESAVFRITSLNAGGFYQPLWASPIEFLGFKDIYASPIFGLNERSDNEVLVIYGLSLVLIGIITLFCIREKKLDLPFWLVSPFFVLFIFIKNSYIDQIHNYQYMKSYTLTCAQLLLFAFLAFWTFGNRNHLIRKLIAVFLLFICVIGGGHIYRVATQGDFITPDMYQLYQVDPIVKFDQYVMLTMGAGIIHYNLIPLFTFNWLNEGNGQKIINPFLDREVAVFLFKGQIQCPSCLIRDNPTKLVFENGTFLVMRTGFPLKSFVNGNTRMINYRDILEKLTLRPS